MSPLRAAIAALVVVVMACAIAGVGMGSATAEREQPPSPGAVAAARERIAAGGATVRRGRELFTEQGCDRCHAIAAVGAGGKLGPRLDTRDEGVDDNLESIAEPRDDIADGYPAELMPTDFDARLDDAQLHALAEFVTAASSGGEEGDDDGGRRRGRGGGRGRSGE